MNQEFKALLYVFWPIIAFFYFVAFLLLFIAGTTMDKPDWVVGDIFIPGRIAGYYVNDFLMRPL